MTFEKFSVEGTTGLSRLELLARDTPDKCLNLEELDRPLAVTQESRAELPEVSDETRTRLEEKGWTSEILDSINSEAEATIYENSALEPGRINGKDVLLRTDIDYDMKDIFGRTNLERMNLGLAPLDNDQKPVELHHIGQKQDSPLAELSRDEHRGKGNDNVLHNKLKESEINREDFNMERQDHWKARADQIGAST